MLHATRHAAREIMVREFDALISSYSHSFPRHELIVMGDFNMNHIIWQYNPDSDGLTYSFSIGNPVSPYERLFLRAIAALGVNQINESPNNIGNSLDLVFVKNIAVASICVPDFTEVFDPPTNIHSLQIIISCSNIVTPIKERTLKRINFARIRNQIANTLFPEIVNINEIIQDPYQILQYINQFTTIIKQIQDANTKVIKIDQTVSNHPWIKGNTYKRLFKEFSRNQSVFNRLRLRQANILLMNEYNGKVL